MSLTSYKQKKLELINKELNLYRREEILKINEELDRCRQALNSDWSKIEHNYHSARQVKETEIAKLDALIEAKKDILDSDKLLCSFLKDIIVNLSKDKSNISIDDANKVNIKSN